MGLRERFDYASQMPHRQGAENPEDERLESTLGLLVNAGLITEEQFDAGVAYGRIALRYLESIDSPSPYGRGNELRELTEDQCFRRKVIYAEACEMLNAAGKKCKVAVDKTAIYGEPSNLQDLRLGLSALVG